MLHKLYCVESQDDGDFKPMTPSSIPMSDISLTVQMEITISPLVKSDKYYSMAHNCYVNNVDIYGRIQIIWDVVIRT